jgi:hypothetical protein
VARTIETRIVKFAELSDKAKQRAMDDYAAVFGYSWADEALNSLKALAAHFGGKMTQFNVDWFDSSYSSAKFEMPDEMDEGEIKAKLDALGSYNAETLRGLGDCILTGFCADEDAIDGFRQAWGKGERDIGKLMEAGFRSWLKAAQADCQDFYTAERFEEHADANEYEYYEDGRAF